MQKCNLICALLILLAVLASCGSGAEPSSEKSKGEDSEVVIKRRDDGTRSSINPVDEDGYIHGVKTNFYEDGKTVHSRVTYVHGKKHGAAMWYYKNGQVHEHTNFTDGHKHGLTKKYYENGALMEELTYEKGEVLPESVKKYKRDGSLKN